MALVSPPAMVCHRYVGLAVQDLSLSLPAQYAAQTHHTHSHTDAFAPFPCSGQLTARNQFTPAAPSTHQQE